MNRAMREVELRNLSKTEQGKFELLRIVQYHKKMRPGEFPESGTLLIQTILDHEFNENGNARSG